jgi:hypothetical protein
MRGRQGGVGLQVTFFAEMPEAINAIAAVECAIGIKPDEASPVFLPEAHQQPADLPKALRPSRVVRAVNPGNAGAFVSGRLPTASTPVPMSRKLCTPRWDTR